MIAPLNKQNSVKFHVPPVWENHIVGVSKIKVEDKEYSLNVKKTFSVYYAVNSEGRPFSVKVDGYNFENEGLNWHKDFPLLKEIYSERGSWLPGIMALWETSSVWKGRCFGMAATSSLYFLNPLLKPKTVRHLITYRMAKDDKDVRKEILRYQIAQSKPEVKDSPNEIFQKLIKHFSQRNPLLPPPILGLKGDKGYHAVTVYRLVYVQESDTACGLIYESSSPGRPQYFKINPSDNTFILPYAKRYKIAQLILPYDLDDRELRSRIRKLAKEYNAQLCREGKNLIALASDVAFLIVDEQGRKLGWWNGQRVNEIPGAEVTDIGGIERYLVPSSLSYTLQLEGKKEGKFDLYMLSKGPEEKMYQVAYEDVSVNETTQAKLEIIPQKTEWNMQIDMDGDGEVDSTMSPTSIEEVHIIEELVGDFNGDGRVDFDDFFSFVSHFGTISGKEGFEEEYDLTGDGKVDFDDFFSFVSNFGRTSAKVALRGVRPEVHVRVREGSDGVELEVWSGAVGFGVEVEYDPKGYKFLGEDVKSEVPVLVKDEAGRLYFGCVSGGARLRFGRRDGLGGRLRVVRAVVYDGMRTISAKVLGEEIAPKFALGMCRPNPFNPRVLIEYSVGEGARVRLGVYDALGRLVRVLVDGYQEIGRHRVVWDGRDGDGRKVAGGVYLVRMEAGSFRAVRKVVLVK